MSLGIDSFSAIFSWESKKKEKKLTPEKEMAWSFRQVGKNNFSIEKLGESIGT